MHNLVVRMPFHNILLLLYYIFKYIAQTKSYIFTRVCTVGISRNNIVSDSNLFTRTNYVPIQLK